MQVPGVYHVESSRFVERGTHCTGGQGRATTLARFRVSGLGLRVQGLRFGFSGLGFRVQGLGFRVHD